MVNGGDRAGWSRPILFFRRVGGYCIRVDIVAEQRRTAAFMVQLS